MKVFLLPVSTDRLVPYCEPSEHDTPDPATGQGRGFWSGLVHRFRDVISAAEQTRRSQSAINAPRGLGARAKVWALRWVADRIAEQRLLWQLRTCEAATLVHPSDLDGEVALERLHQELKTDGDRHRRWMVVDFALFLVSGILALVPGPNVIAYYFCFRVVGHYLSMRGARQGRDKVTWSLEPSQELQELRAALHLDPNTRGTRLRDIAKSLQLPHLVTFIERVAFKSA